MYTLIIKVAPQGTSLGNNLTSNLSISGHAWYSVMDNKGIIDSYGFNSKNVSKDDDKLYYVDNYLGKIYEKIYLLQKLSIKN